MLYGAVAVIARAAPVVSHAPHGPRSEACTWGGVDRREDSRAAGGLGRDAKDSQPTQAAEVQRQSEHPLPGYFAEDEEGDEHPAHAPGHLRALTAGGLCIAGEEGRLFSRPGTGGRAVGHRRAGGRAECGLVQVFIHMSCNRRLTSQMSKPRRATLLARLTSSTLESVV